MPDFRCAAGGASVAPELSVGEAALTDSVRRPQMTVIALWAAPRSRSTAFFRAMVQHGGFHTLHEPFCNVADYGETQVGSRIVHTHPELITAIRELAATGPVFFKDTTDTHYPAVLADTEFLRQVRHTFLIRRPDEVAASFYALKPDMACSDIGLERMWELYQAVLAAGGHEPVCLDAADLVARPAEVLRAYCERTGTEFRPAALSWSPGPRQEWRRSERWHVSVSDSSRIDARSTRYRDSVDNNEMLAAFSAHHEPFYRLLHDRRLVP